MHTKREKASNIKDYSVRFWGSSPHARTNLKSLESTAFSRLFAFLKSIFRLKNMAKYGIF